MNIYPMKIAVTDDLKRYYFHILKEMADLSGGDTLLPHRARTVKNCIKKVDKKLGMKCGPLGLHVTLWDLLLKQGYLEEIETKNFPSAYKKVEHGKEKHSIRRILPNKRYRMSFEHMGAFEEWLSKQEKPDIDYVINVTNTLASRYILKQIGAVSAIGIAAGAILVDKYLYHGAVTDPLINTISSAANNAYEFFR